MLRDPELAALIDQALRNADTLELLARNGGAESDVQAVRALHARLAALRADYTKETDELTRHVLQRAIERRRGPDRRRKPDEMQEPAVV